MALRDFLAKQFIDVIHWTEPRRACSPTVTPCRTWRYRTGPAHSPGVAVGRLCKRRAGSRRIQPGLYTLGTHTLPILTYLRNWDKAFKSPFKSDVYFLSTRLQTNQRWGTAMPITIRDKEFGAVRLRAFGIYSYRISDAKIFYTKVSGTREIYRVADIEGQLRNTIIGRMTDTFAQSQVPSWTWAANQIELGQKIAGFLQPVFNDLGLSLDTFVVENLSLPDELPEDSSTSASA